MLTNIDDLLPSNSCKYIWTVAELRDTSNPLDQNTWVSSETGGSTTGVNNQNWQLTTGFTNYNASTGQGEFKYKTWYLFKLELIDCECSGDATTYQLLYNEGR